jgi:hypothetical protein
MDVLNYVKLSEVCENKVLCVISQKYKSFCAKVLITNVTLIYTRGHSVRMLVIITLHKNLHLAPKPNEICLQ